MSLAKRLWLESKRPTVVEACADSPELRACRRRAVLDHLRPIQQANLSDSEMQIRAQSRSRRPR